jgi:sulfur carrier protein ThiS
MGTKNSIKSVEIIRAIEPTVNQIVETIADKIQLCNGKSPNAVFCIGGGSQTPHLVEKLAKKLELPIERVAIRGTEIIKNIKFTNKHLDGPEAITPVGIGVTVLMKKGHNFITVSVNGDSVRLFNSGIITVADAVGISGFTPAQLIPKAGESITVELNGKKHVIRGGYGRTAEIYVNDNPASLDTPLNEGDKVKVIPSVEGYPAKAYISDFVLDFEEKKIMFNGRYVDITSKVMVNDNIPSKNQEIKNEDKIFVEEIKNIKDLSKICEIDLNAFEIFVNGSKVKNEYILKSGDIVTTVSKTDGVYELEEDTISSLVDNDIIIEKTNELNEEIGEPQVKDNDSQNSIEEKNDTHKRKITVIINEEEVILSGKESYIFIDIFNHYNFDLSEPKGRVILKLNGKPVGFTDTIRDGDIIEIYWEAK